VSGLDLGNGHVLARGDTFVVYGLRRVVWCELDVPGGLNPARGAAAAEEMTTFLLDRVLERHSAWLGVVIDMRRGPSVLGPISLRATERVLERAESVRRRLAVLTGLAPTLEDQLSALVRARAPRFALVTTERSAALDWMTSSG
jgi:hypothetical protein